MHNEGQCTACVLCPAAAPHSACERLRESVEDAHCLLACLLRVPICMHSTYLGKCRLMCMQEKCFLNSITAHLHPMYSAYPRSRCMHVRMDHIGKEYIHTYVCTYVHTCLSQHSTAQRLNKQQRPAKGSQRQSQGQGGCNAPTPTPACERASELNGALRGLALFVLLHRRGR
ncbi:hypothetical protein IWX90DRAFT_322854 [Phyllosticta citrichinensis]|uniref:Uncharacterized protein n=1 Tax=Phyllosticta citrichinensis TaxID=1130410 RepID=A0ABR1XJV1_9PEZI